MLLLTFILIPAILAVDQEITINNHIVKITEDTLMSVEPPMSYLTLNLSGLGLRILAEDAFENLTSLENLDLGNNLLSSIPKQLFSNLRNLEYLSLANNNLISFKKIFEGLDDLKTLDISNNPINSLKASALSGLPKSSVIITKGISFETISAFVFEKDPLIIFKKTNICKRSIRNDQNSLRQAQKQDESVKTRVRRKRAVDNDRLIKICIDGDVLKQVEPVTINEVLPSHCHRGQLNEGRDSLDLKNLGIAVFEKNWYQFDRTTPIYQILLAGNNIVHVTPELVNDLPKNVRKIDIESNKIEQLKEDVLENTSIKMLNLKSNAIREIEDRVFTKMTSLNELHLDDNLLNNTAFMATLPRKIRTLRVSRNKITEISPGSFLTLSALKFLYLNGNQIQEVKSNSFHGLGYLLELILSDNHISKIDRESFQQLRNMYLLALNNNSIVSFESGTFDNLRSFRHLHVNHNKLSSINKSFPNGLPSNLVTLNIAFNGIEKLEIDNFKNVPLTNLVLRGNKISEIEHGALELPALRELYLDSNKLVQLETDSFRGLDNVGVLNLAHNYITRIPKRFTENLNHLDELDLSYNPIRRLQNGALYGFRKAAHNRVFLRGVSVEAIEGGLFDDFLCN